MSESVKWFDEVDKDDVDIVGGKAASLGEMTRHGLPVANGFVVTTHAYRKFIEDTGIESRLFKSVDINPDDSAALQQANQKAEELVRNEEIPKKLKREIKKAYSKLGNSSFVAVRSSATAEDLPDASFAGQQETYLNVQGDEELIERVRDCWASLFTKRAIYYRNEKGFSHDSINMAVVVQEMVDADKSGVVFTSHPSTGERVMTIEAAWGLGEAVVSGSVTPDNYVLDRDTREIVSKSVSEKKIMHIRDPESGKTAEVDVPRKKRKKQVLDEYELTKILELGEELEEHYDHPQDIEWAKQGDDFYVLQSRPITTINNDESNEMKETRSNNKTDTIIEGLGASPGIATGRVRKISNLDELDKVESGDVLVTQQTTPDMVPAMKRAAAIVTDEGGMTSHAAIVSRELRKVAVVGTGDSTSTLEDDEFVKVDGDKGSVSRIDESDALNPELAESDEESARDQRNMGVITGTEVKVNISIPDASESAADTGAEGVGLLRVEHMILGLGMTPSEFIKRRGEKAYMDELVEGIREVAEAFYPRPVRARTLDAPTDEFRNLKGGDSEPIENNPMMGFRGIRRSLSEPEIFDVELRAFRKLYDMGYDNVELMFPLVNDASDIRGAKLAMDDAGLDVDDVTWGVMIETPSAALMIDEIIDEGVDFVSLGTNDLTQYTLSADRNNENVSDIYDEMHPAVLRLIENVVTTANDRDVRSSICGQAGSYPDMVEFLVESGISSVSANIDAVGDVRERIARVERRLLLRRARDSE